MAPPNDPATDHWQTVYQSKPADAVSWFRPHLDVSLTLMAKAGLHRGSRVLDVGGGASTLVDDLLAQGVSQISVLDLSSEALMLSRERLGPAGQSVSWIAGNLLTEKFPEGRFDLWHDRAVLHFLTDQNDVSRYAAQARRAVRPGGHAVIGGFAPDGPERCSGLPVARRSALEIAQALSPGFELIESSAEQHLSPSGSAQSFIYALLRRV